MIPPEITLETPITAYAYTHGTPEERAAYIREVWPALEAAGAVLLEGSTDEFVRYSLTLGQAFALGWTAEAVNAAYQRTLAHFCSTPYEYAEVRRRTTEAIYRLHDTGSREMGRAA